jgi:hypothetical protein
MAAVLACVSASVVAQEQPAPQQQQALTPQQQQNMIATQHELCGVTQVTDATRASYLPIPGFTILQGQPPFSAPPGSVQAVICDRTSIFLGPNDHHVITDLRVPLYIRNAGRVAVLEAENGQLRVTFRQGRPTPQEMEALAAALDVANADMPNALREAAAAQARPQQ